MKDSSVFKNTFIETIYEGEHYKVPYLEMGSWFAYMKDLSVFTKDCGNCQIQFSDTFSKYKLKINDTR